MPTPAAFNRMTRTIRNSASRMTRTQKLSAVGVAVVGASVLAVSVVPGSVQAANPSNPAMSVAKVAGAAHPGATTTPTAAPAAHTHTTDLAKRLLTASKKAETHSVPHVTTVKKADVAKKTAAHQHNKKTAHQHATAHLKAKMVAASSPAYPDNLNGWIHHALAIMHKHHIPGSYEGIHRNIMRESSGNPNAINLWDVNAQHGIPSQGLLQVIPPTFATYHVAGTPDHIKDPVANIVAACNYAAHRYGTIDNVNSAY